MLVNKSYIEGAIDDIAEVTKLDRVHEERRDEVHLALQIRVRRKLVLPSIRNAVLPKVTRFSSECRHKGARLEL